MRCFVSVDLDPSLRNAVRAVQKKFDGLGKIKFTEPENLHFTIKFLGEVKESQLEKIKEELDRVAKNNSVFLIDIRGVGAFPSTNYIRVLWLGVEKNKEKMANLQQQVNRAVPGKKSDTPHLTICRDKYIKDRKRMSEILERLERVRVGEMAVKSIKLKKSTLTPKGPIYEDLGIFYLSEPERG
ncbi:MAG: RNA 2',3'-cyclic phosphodiesterase [Candidatus Aenigmatarchaeota archaeon]|nr:MAG: RNA 2',3'-cyclic phosphodiesterase [Candidatus Aenigmarchaeota archaeon]